MKNIPQIACVCVLRTRRSVLTFCQDSKIVSVAIQNPNTLEHLRKIQCSKIVIEFTIELNLKNITKHPVYSMFIERKYNQQEA
jgi:hypothetical protein